MKTARGYTLIELIVVIFVLGFIVLGVFALFTFGSRSYQQAVLRTGLQGDARRAAAILQRQLKLTHYSTVGFVNREVTLPDGLVVRRDAVAMAALSDWTDPGNFSGGLFPVWDRYVVIYATTEELGRLVVQDIEPGGALPDLSPYPGLTDNIRDEPGANQDVFSTGILSQNVLSFQVDKNEVNQMVDVIIRFRGRGGKAATSERVIDETHELVMSLRTWNTYPEL